MPPPPDPFIDVTVLASMLAPRILTDAEKLLAAPLLDVVSGWIRDNKPNVTPDDPAAVVVAFEVTRDALTYGKFRALSTFSRETSHSKESGTLQFREIERFITSRHREMLGIGTSSARPVYYFGD